jgi:hypothetical protein
VGGGGEEVGSSGRWARPRRVEGDRARPACEQAGELEKRERRVIGGWIERRVKTWIERTGMGQGAHAEALS